MRRISWVLLAMVATGCGDAVGGPDAGEAADAGHSIDAGVTTADAAIRHDGAMHAADAGSDSAVHAADAGIDAARDAGPPPTPLAENRDRLLGTYLDHLRAHPDQTQSNGLRGADLTSVCDLWSRLDPSSQAVYLTLTARMQGSILGGDGSAMLDHVTRLYRLTGGEGATATDAGSCGGGEYNRMIMSMDPALHDALTAAHAHQGARGPGGVFDIADIPSDGSWRDTHDLAGPHSPFDQSDETGDGAPRGQVHYFADPSSSAATSPLGRVDVESVVDAYALEMDQDYDCAHASNPLCEYTFYGTACLPRTTKLGLDIYVDNYGSVEPDWTPLGC